ncbi:MAG: tRNA (adenosine(37)-N6)-dimethylallyltransferase MiaA [Oscillospiraceae bacterium]|nr:tRNA (adenosine(37)-N6)-dimethylallyltransferase MiaA [Oscillospiraceae bacterium]
MKTRLIVVAGATASGKTALAIELAKRFNGEIVSADSMQIYKYMDIGSAKPTSEERAAVPHHLIDFLEPDAQWSVADYTALAHEVITDISARGKTPIMAGGTGLYINSVVNDVSFGEIDTDCKIREELQSIADAEGGEKLIEILNEFDSESAQKLHPNNVRRVIRAIEFYRVTGTPISKHQEMTRQAQTRYEPQMFTIEWDRKTLYDRINRRVDMMMSDGLLDEVKRLMEMGYTKDMNSMKGIGYKELIDYLNGECSIDEADDLIKQSSRRYAKRQLTWFRRDERIQRLSPENAVEEAARIIEGH